VPIVRWDDERAKKLGSIVREGAVALSTRLGHRST
jgi:hypothetical protein